MISGTTAAPATWRDNGRVTDGPATEGTLPPPSGTPPSGTAVAAMPAGEADAPTPPLGATSRSPGLRSALAWWFGPVVQPATWVGLGYLFVGVFTGIIGFALAVSMFAVTLPLIVVAVGVPLTGLAFGAVDRLATLERRRAEWVGPAIPARPFEPTHGSWWRRLWGRLRSATRWRQLAFLLAAVVTGPVLFAVGILPWVLLLRLAFGADFLTANVGGLLVAGGLSGLAARATAGVANVAHRHVAWFLGPDRTAELEARVDSLSGQRQEILDAVAAERRRIERNLHDGVQQQLVALGIDIGRASARLDEDPEAARRLLDEARQKVHDSVGELRTIGRGLHPAVLDDRGLDAALSAVVSGAPIPIEVTVDVRGPVPTEVAETAYYVVNEAVANILKHARARVASIDVAECDSPVPSLLVTVHDDGRGGAVISHGGTGLAGMAARVRGADGSFVVESPRGGPTVVRASIPLAVRQRGEVR